MKDQPAAMASDAEELREINLRIFYVTQPDTNHPSSLLCNEL